MKTWMWKIWAVAILPAFAVAAQDVLVYDNTTTDTGYALMFTNNQEIGDQIWLDNATHPYLTGFSFEYYSPNLSFSQTSIAVDVRFYLNDGSPFNGYSTPSTLFYDTGWFDVQTPLSYFPGTNVAVLSFYQCGSLYGCVVEYESQHADALQFHIYRDVPRIVRIRPSGIAFF